jgi:hypothetical protein
MDSQCSCSYTGIVGTPFHWQTVQVLKYPLEVHDGAIRTRPWSLAKQASTRLAHLVYLDAFLPEHGKAQRDYFDGSATDELVQMHGGSWRFPMPGISNARDFQCQG